MLRSLAGRAGARRHPLLVERPEKHVTLVVVTGDKGLCGAFNGNVLREASALLGGGRWERVELVLVGRRGIDFFRRRSLGAVAVFAELMNGVTAAGGVRGGALARRAVRERQDRRHLPALQPLPLDHAAGGDARAAAAGRADADRGGAPAASRHFFEPSPQALLGAILPRHVQFQVLRSLLDSQAAEQASRMTAMDAASKNAADMIDRLTLTYNRARQASITKELIEIVSGAQALAER